MSEEQSTDTTKRIEYSCKMSGQSTDMTKRIEMESRLQKPESIKALILDNCRSTHVEGLTENFVNLENLSMINIGLTTLKGFPALPNLTKLELSDNRISGNLDFLVECKKLKHLSLSGNKIKDLETLTPLQQLDNLRNLDLFNCEVTNIDCYRDKVYELLPNLVYLDGFDQDDHEYDEDELGDEDEENCEQDDDDDDDDDGDEEDEDEDLDEDDDEDGDDDDDEEGDEDDDEEDYDEDEDEGVGLSALAGDPLEDDEDEEDYIAQTGGDEDEDLDEDEEEEEGEVQQGIKRKREDVENDDDGDD